MTHGCLFCKIVNGDIPADIVGEGTRTLAFRDVSPQAPTHLLIIPKEHYETVADLIARAPDVLLELHRQATEVVEAEGIAESGYRLVYNTGRDGHQSVQHVHLHILGGRALTWPPG